MSETDIIGQIVGQQLPDYIVFTGGEPALQNLGPLIDKLREANYGIAIETNGTLPIRSRFRVDWVSCSPKPGNRYEIHDEVQPDELKYVVDQFFTVDVIATRYLGIIPIWLQPQGYDMQKSAQRAYEIVMRTPGTQLGIQMHKIFELK